MISAFYLFFIFTILLPQQIVGQAINCARQNFGVALNSCCKKPALDFAVDPFLKQCNPRKLVSLTQWANDYALNKAQNFKNGNTLDITKDQVAIGLMCTAGTFMNCLFTKGGFLMQNGTLKEAAIFDYIRSKAPADDEEWQYILEDILDTATPIDFWIPKTFREGVMCPGARRSDPKIRVTLSAVILSQLFQMALSENCPEPIETNRCYDIWDKFYECTDFVWEILDFEDYALGNATSKNDTKQRRSRGSLRKMMKSMKEKKLMQMNLKL